MTPNPQAADTGVSAEVIDAEKAWRQHLDKANRENWNAVTFDPRHMNKIVGELDRLRTALLAGAAGGQAKPVGTWLSMGSHARQRYYELHGEQLPDNTPLYTAPPPPVGAPQGAKDMAQQIFEEQEEDFRAASDFVNSPPNVARRHSWIPRCLACNGPCVLLAPEATPPSAALATPSPAQAEPIVRIMGEACANCHGSGVGMDGKACPLAPHRQATYKIKTTKLEPGSEAYFAMMGAEFGYNFLGSHEYRTMQAYSRKLWDAALSTGAAEGAEPTADAERYQYLRNSKQRCQEDGMHPVDGSVWVVKYSHPKGTIPELNSAGTGAELDANVDAAIRAAQKGRA